VNVPRFIYQFGLPDASRPCNCRHSRSIASSWPAEGLSFNKFSLCYGDTWGAASGMIVARRSRETIRVVNIGRQTGRLGIKKIRCQFVYAHIG
jgi:hypothetical protein